MKNNTGTYGKNTIFIYFITLMVNIFIIYSIYQYVEYGINYFKNPLVIFIEMLTEFIFFITLIMVSLDSEFNL
jgi:hypothetical protein